MNIEQEIDRLQKELDELKASISVKKDPLAVDETTPIGTLCWMWYSNRKFGSLRKLYKYAAGREFKFSSDFATAWLHAERAVLFQPRPHSGDEPPKDWEGYGMIMRPTGIHVYKDNQSYLGFKWSGVTGYFLPEDLGWEE